MPKRIPYGHREVLRNLLKAVRVESRVTQVQLAKRLGKPQSFVSRYEQGERRLDVLELREICEALGTTLAQFAKRLERLLAREYPGRSRLTAR